jgi:hypothetical protein
VNIFRSIGRIQVRLLNSEAKRDYLFCILLPLSSFFLAWAIGNFYSVKLAPNSSLYQACQACQTCQACKSTTSKDIIFKGYGSRLNWLHFLVTVPLSLYTLRWAARRLFGWNAGSRRSERAPILDVFSNSPPQSSVADHLQAVLVDPRNLASALFLAVLIHIADMWELLSIYAAGRNSAGCPREGDWSLFFLVPGARISWPSNLIQVALAYSSQFVVATIALLVFIIFLRYNMFYLGSIYQRYRDRDVTSCIILNFDDPDHCFGQGSLHSVFNVQIFSWR